MFMFSILLIIAAKSIPETDKLILSCSIIVIIFLFIELISIITCKNKINTKCIRYYIGIINMLAFAVYITVFIYILVGDNTIKIFKYVFGPILSIFFLILYIPSVVLPFIVIFYINFSSACINYRDDDFLIVIHNVFGRS